MISITKLSLSLLKSHYSVLLYVFYHTFSLFLAPFCPSRNWGETFLPTFVHKYKMFSVFASLRKYMYILSITLTFFVYSGFCLQQVFGEKKKSSSRENKIDCNPLVKLWAFLCHTTGIAQFQGCLCISSIVLLLLPKPRKFKSCFAIFQDLRSVLSVFILIWMRTSILSMARLVTKLSKQCNPAEAGDFASHFD